MKPIAFEFERPSDLGEAIKLLGDDQCFVKPIAGSQSLGPMLNLRLAQPDLLVDITGVEELVSVSEDSDHLLLGACVTHANIEDCRIPDVTNGFMRYVAGRIAYRAVRNRGTIGGSLAHADPAADWISVLPVLGADVVVASQRGKRHLPTSNLMKSSFTTDLQSDELISAVRVPKCSPEARWGYYKLNQKVGEFAHAIGAILIDPTKGRFRAVGGAVETTPIVFEDARILFGGKTDGKLAERLDAQQVLSRLDEKGITDGYSRRAVLTALKRAAALASGS